MLREASEAAGQGAGTETALDAISESDQQRMLREAAEAMRQSEAEAHEALGESSSSETNGFNWPPIAAGIVVLALLSLLWMTFAGGERSSSEEDASDAVVALVPSDELSEVGKVPEEALETDGAVAAGGDSPTLTITGAEAELPPPSPPLAAVEGTLTDWASSWADQRVDDYLAHYASAFSPPDGSSRGAWEKNRHDRIGRPDWIRVTLGTIEASSTEPGRATASFEQTYESPNYRDRVAKTVELVWEDDVWKILSEASQPLG